MFASPPPFFFEDRCVPCQKSFGQAVFVPGKPNSQPALVRFLWVLSCDGFYGVRLLCSLLLQYPVRPANMNYDDVTHLTAKIKPKQQKVRLCL